MTYKYHKKYMPRQTPQVKRALRANFKSGSRTAKRNFAAAGKKAATAALVVVVTVVLFFAAKWTKKNFIEAEKFKIKKITVTGFVNVPQKEFLEKLPVSYGDNVILSYAIGINGAMKKEFPGIKSIRVSRKITGELNLVVLERQPVAWRLSETGAVEGVDCENVCFRLKPGERLVPELVLMPPDARIRSRSVALLNDLIKRKEKLYSDITKLYNVGEEFFMVLKNSSRIIWGRYDGEDIGPKLSRLYSVINDSKVRFAGFEYIDLQLAGEGRVVVSPARKGRKSQ